MTVKHLRIFVTVYREMSITRAAERLYMTQPAVTRAIREIEEHYGIRLFERMNHRLYRTAAGDALYARALHILDSFDAMEKELGNADSAGVLRVGTSITVGTFLLPKAAAAFAASHPQVQLRATVSNTANIEAAILENTVDLGIVEGSVSSPYILAEPFSADRLCLILPPAHPLCTQQTVHLRDLVAYPMLLREPGSAGRTLLDRIFAAEGLSLSPLWESVSTQALIGAVAAGVGISILPEKLVMQDVLRGKVAVKAVCDAPFDRENLLIRHRQKYLTTAAKDFIALCRELCCP